MASVEKPPLRKGSPLAPGLARSPPSSYSLLSLPRGLLFSLVPFSLGLDICLCACSVAQSYLTLCDPLDCSTPGFSVHGILQARILEEVAMPRTRGSSPSRDRTCISSGSCIAGGFFTTEPPGKPGTWHIKHSNCSRLKKQPLKSQVPLSLPPSLLSFRKNASGIT